MSKLICLSYFIIRILLLSNESQTGSRSGWEKQGVTRRGNCNQDILSKKINTFNKRGKAPESIYWML